MVDSAPVVDSEPHVDAQADDSGRRRKWVSVALLALTFVLAAAAALKVTDGLAPFAVILICGGIVGVVGLRNPLWALMFLLVTLLFRLALPDVPANPFLAASALLVISTGIWLVTNSSYRPKLGAVEVAMLLYVGWNVYSMAQDHEFPAWDVDFTGHLSLWRYLLVGTVIPFVVYYVSRALFGSIAAIRTMLVTVVVLAAYSAAVSIMQFTGPTALVWPRYIIDAPNWPDRANGVLNQPGSNGVVLIIGYAVAILLAATMTRTPWRRVVLWGIAAACGYAIYLTHTRAVYLGFVLVVVIGALLAKGFRRPFVTTLIVLGIGLALNWSTFTSSDREAGGVGSTNEVYDRLNADATALWAFAEKPWTGWGLGRFLAVNTFHHQQYAPDVPWIRGLSVASHFNELGILAELGIIGLGLWLAVLVMVIAKLIRGIRTLPSDDAMGRPLAVTALMAMSALSCLGVFADLRLLDYPNAVAFCMAGAAAGTLDRFRNATAVAPYVRIPRLRR
ncbi:MAG: hypothetical protein QOI01_211 [Mycobacterium sp.]|jgi:O-antigen ligase|nr:hypothetical protein [Mycobacterium sp.]